MGSSVGQDSAPVVVVLAMTSQLTTRNELIIVQLEESEFTDVHDTQKSVTVDSEHDVGEGEGSGVGPGSRAQRTFGVWVIRVIEPQSWPRNTVEQAKKMTEQPQALVPTSNPTRTLWNSRSMSNRRMLLWPR